MASTARCAAGVAAMRQSACWSVTPRAAYDQRQSPARLHGDRKYEEAPEEMLGRAAPGRVGPPRGRWRRRALCAYAGAKVSPNGGAKPATVSRDLAERQSPTRLQKVLRCRRRSRGSRARSWSRSADGVEEGARVERWPHGVDCNLSRSYAGKGLRRRIGQRRKTVSMCHVTASGAGLSARLSGRPITSPCRA